MDIHFSVPNPHDFDPDQYIKTLITIAKADRFNGAPEYDYVRCQAEQYGIDFDQYWQMVDKDYVIPFNKISRLTALMILRGCLYLASMDHNVSLSEEEIIYTYAQQLDIPRTDVDILRKWLEMMLELKNKWEKLVSGHYHLNMFDTGKQ